MFHVRAFLEGLRIVGAMLLAAAVVLGGASFLCASLVSVLIAGGWWASWVVRATGGQMDVFAVEGPYAAAWCTVLFFSCVYREGRRYLEGE